MSKCMCVYHSLITSQIETHFSSFVSSLKFYVYTFSQLKTYAIDIFACGLLAFYVLTDGNHPFDAACSDEESSFTCDPDVASSGSNPDKSRNSSSTWKHHRFIFAENSVP